jgi:hypothetical protein
VLTIFQCIYQLSAAIFSLDGNGNLFESNAIFSWTKTTTAESSFLDLEKKQLGSKNWNEQRD